MKRIWKTGTFILLFGLGFVIFSSGIVPAAQPVSTDTEAFPRSLESYNDVDAAITFLSTLVPNFSDSLKYMVVAGAVAGGDLTIIANAPNPAGVSILKKYFNNEVSPA